MIMVKARSFHGDLSLLSAVNLFQLIGFASLTGHLVVRYTENTTHFIFTAGKLNFGFSKKRRQKIGQALLDSQLITSDQLEICLTDQKTSQKWNKLGAIVVKNGFLRRSQVSDFFYQQSRDALFETITWREGRFTFVDNSPFTDEDIVLEENIESLIFKGLIFLDEMGRDDC
jgi:hypothetical protein